MEKLSALLHELHPNEELSFKDALIDDGHLDSLDIVSLVTDINEAYGIEIGAEDITPENFNSLSAISALIKRRGGVICS